VVLFQSFVFVWRHVLWPPRLSISVLPLKGHNKRVIVKVETNDVELVSPLRNNLAVLHSKKYLSEYNNANNIIDILLVFIVSLKGPIR